MPLRRKPFRDVTSPQDIAHLAKTPFARLEWLIENRAGLYGRFKQPKKKGGYRIITPPCKELKDIQYRIKDYIDERIRWPQHLRGGIDDESVVTNAKPHIGQDVVGNFDVKDFFPSTPEDRVTKLFRDGGMATTAAELVAALCGFEGHLPQGAPTSTCLGNLAFLPVDARLLFLIRRHGFIYTRFVDDLTISGENVLRSFKGTVIQEIGRGGYRTSLAALLGRNEPQIVTGLIVNEKLRPSTEFIQQLKRDIRDCWPEEAGVEVVAANYGLTIPKLKRRFLGRISHIRQFNRKTAREVRGLMVKIRWP